MTSLRPMDNCSQNSFQSVHEDLDIRALVSGVILPLAVSLDISLGELATAHKEILDRWHHIIPASFHFGSSVLSILFISLRPASHFSCTSPAFLSFKHSNADLYMH